MTQTVQPPPAELSDPDVLSPDEGEALVAEAPWKRFVVLGDSVAKGVGEPAEGYADVRWGARVAAALSAAQPSLEYTNLGRRDARAAEIRDEQLEAALELRPDLVGYVGGGNDMLVHEFDVAPAAAVIDETIAALVETGATVVTYTMMNLPSAYSHVPGMEQLDERLRLVNDAVTEISERRGALLVDLYPLPVCADPGIYSSDLQHGNMRGQAIAASHTLRRLGQYLREGR